MKPRSFFAEFEGAQRLQDRGRVCRRVLESDPTRNNDDLNKITTVMKSGNVYDPAAIEKAMGIAPRKTGP